MSEFEGGAAPTSKHKKYLEYGAIGVGSLILVMLIMKRGSTAGATTDTSGVNTNQPLIVPASSGSGGSDNTDLTAALTQLANQQQTQTDALAQALSNQQQQESANSQAMLQAIQQNAQSQQQAIQTMGDSIGQSLSTLSSLLNRQAQPVVSQVPQIAYTPIPPTLASVVSTPVANPTSSHDAAVASGGGPASVNPNSYSSAAFTSTPQTQSSKVDSAGYTHTITTRINPTTGLKEVISSINA